MSASDGETRATLEARPSSGGPCRICGANRGSIGIVEEEDGTRHTCRVCLDRESIDGFDRYFGVGVPGLIAEECYRLRDMLHDKNRKYGNSALQPLRVMSRADPEEQIRVRIDDKLSRLARGAPGDDEDVIADLLGYLILLRVARRTGSP